MAASVTLKSAEGRAALAALHALNILGVFDGKWYLLGFKCEVRHMYMGLGR